MKMKNLTEQMEKNNLATLSMATLVGTPVQHKSTMQQGVR